MMGRRTVCSASKEEEHGRGLYARVAQYSSCYVYFPIRGRMSRRGRAGGTMRVRQVIRMLRVRSLGIVRMCYSWM